MAIGNRDETHYHIIVLFFLCIFFACNEILSHLFSILKNLNDVILSYFKIKILLIFIILLILYDSIIAYIQILMILQSPYTLLVFSFP